MSKQGKRKITVELPKAKDLGIRPSVFERLGTKKSTSVLKKPNEYCRQWAQNGTCAYGKSCKFANTHTLISPSKQRAAIKDVADLKKGNKDDNKNRLHSTVVVRSGRSPDGEMDNWDQNDLEYADTDVLEKRRKQLQRELELQLKMESNKDIRKEKKKPVVSSSSSRSSSSSSITSSSSDGSSSSSSSNRDSRKKGKKGKLKRHSSSSPDDHNLKKKQMKPDPKRDKVVFGKKVVLKKDDIRNKKPDSNIIKKKTLTKVVLKKSLSPGKKSGGTPPIGQKNMPKGYAVHRNISKSPMRKERNRSTSQHSASKDKGKDKLKEREKDRLDRFRRSKSPKPRARSKSSQRVHSSNSKDARSSERNRVGSPKKQVRKDLSSDRHRKLSPKRDRSRDFKDRERDRKDAPGRSQDRGRDRKREQDSKGPRGRDRDRGLNKGVKGLQKGLQKPTNPTERLLPRPEERLAALAAISNRPLTEKPGPSKEGHDRSRKSDRTDKTGKRLPDGHPSMDRDREYNREYDRPRSIEMNYNRGDHYDNVPREEGNHSPSYLQNRDRMYDAGYDRGYADPQDHPYDERHIDDRRNIEFDERHGGHDHGWDNREGGHEDERGYSHHKEWEDEGYRGDVYMQDRHWQHRDPQGREWIDKDRELDGQWHGRSTRGRRHDDSYGRGGRHDQGQKRSAQSQRPPDTETAAPKRPPAANPPTAQAVDGEEVPIPDDLSEISDDPDDILNRDDAGDHGADKTNPAEDPSSEPIVNEDGSLPKDGVTSSSAVSDKKADQNPEEGDDGMESLDFEEISDGELEEDQKIKGLGDALGVDWASLVAEVRKDKQLAQGEQRKLSEKSARAHWQPLRVLARIGLSVRMAGEQLVQEIICSSNADRSGNEASAEKPIFTLHPVASIQTSSPRSRSRSPQPGPSHRVAMRKRASERAGLVSGSPGARAECARRDLALRRRLCGLALRRRRSPGPSAPPGAGAGAAADRGLLRRARALLAA